MLAKELTGGEQLQLLLQLGAVAAVSATGKCCGWGAGANAGAGAGSGAGGAEAEQQEAQPLLRLRLHLLLRARRADWLVSWRVLDNLRVQV